GTTVSLEDLVTLYAALADRGRHKPISFTADSTTLTSRRMLSKTAAWYVDDILRTRPLTAGLAPKGVQGGRIRYKTGTSYGFRDAWAIGYTPWHTVGIWIGRPDWGYGKQTTGANSAVPVLFQVFAALTTFREQPNEGRLLYAGRPAGIMPVRHNQLPPHLQWFSRSTGQGRQPGKPSIYFPVDGSTMRLEQNAVLILKAHGGTPPFHWVVNDHPLGREHRGAIVSYIPQGMGMTKIMLMDSRGRRDKVSVWLELSKSRLSWSNRQ
ncbi:MAG: hypothetical protein D3924_20245, partial [Candidatus Electrothrix sp. AR4]|nr:hypothetical protein [Candidatus Electrothrix sp. AR4]